MDRNAIQIDALIYMFYLFNIVFIEIFVFSQIHIGWNNLRKTKW